MKNLTELPRKKKGGRKRKYPYMELEVGKWMRLTGPPREMPHSYASSWTKLTGRLYRAYWLETGEPVIKRER